MIKILNYEKAKDIKLPANDSEELSLVIYDTVQNFPEVIKDFLMNLTGIDLSTNEKLYDYFQKTLKYNKEEMKKLQFNDLRDSIDRIEINISDIFKDIK
jgi:hypothetical protein